MKPRTLLLIVSLAGLVSLCACHRQFTKDRFDTIQVGTDSRDDVRMILGKPTADLGDQWMYDNLKRHKSAVIHFDEQGRVRGKEWMDAHSGQWEGQHPEMPPPPKGEVRERHRSTTRIDED